jgi:hypothetical protein
MSGKSLRGRTDKKFAIGAAASGIPALGWYWLGLSHVHYLIPAGIALCGFTATCALLLSNSGKLHAFTDDEHQMWTILLTLTFPALIVWGFSTEFSQTLAGNHLHSSLMAFIGTLAFKWASDITAFPLMVATICAVIMRGLCARENHRPALDRNKSYWPLGMLKTFVVIASFNGIWALVATNLVGHVTRGLLHP